MKNYVKCAIALLTMAGSGYQSSAKAVDEYTARTTGSNFLISEGITGVRTSEDLSVVYTATDKVNGATVTDYYVFNIVGSQGFVMVSADDRVIPILAYSGESAFDINHISPATKDWIGRYRNEITSVIANSLPAKAGTVEIWSNLLAGNTKTTARTTSTTAVTPLVTTTWDQDGGASSAANSYNGACPNTSTTGGLSVTGCVATAMAQVMKFWNWPTVGCGLHTYYDTYDASQAMGSNSWNTADYGNTAYSWSTMPLTSSNAAVATLMYHAGVAVNMSYSANESGSYVTTVESDVVNCAEYALKSYFHYKPSVHHLLRFGIPGNTLGSYYYGQGFEYYGGSYAMIDSVPEATWITTLQTELNAGRPMLYEGTGTAGGHCWVCDGWETSGNKFHFNWGWSGASNGYYTVDNLAPPALGTGGGAGNFNYDDGVVMGIQPDSFPSNPGNIELQAHLDCSTSSPMKYGTPFNIVTKIMNAGTATFTGDFCAQVYDSSNTLLGTMATISGQTISAGATSTALTFSCTATSYLMIPVSYHSIRVAYRPTGTTTWTPVANSGSYINYTIMDVMNDTDMVLFDSLHVGSHTIAAGSAITVSTSIGNQSYTDNFSGTIQAVLINTTTGASFTIQQHTSEHINDNYDYATLTFTNSDVSVTPGVYALEIQHQYNGSGNFYTTSSDYYVNPILMTVTGGTATGVTPVTATSDVYVYPNPASDLINILIQGVDVTALRMMDVQGRTVKILDAGKQTVITVPVSDLAAGVYFLEAETATGTITKKIVITK